MIWHSTEISSVLEKFEVDASKGLHKGVVELRSEKYGKNIVTEKEEKKFTDYLAEQFKNKTVIALFIISLISFALSLFYGDNDFYTPLLIVGIIIVNLFISAYQLMHCEKTLNSIKKFSNPSSKVLRDGMEMIIPSEDLVPGDILILEEGDFISADARIIESNELRLNEMSLTGSEIPTEKDAYALFEDITPVIERKNMVYSGTSVAHGTAKAVVVAIGFGTEAGRTTEIMREAGKESKLPLQNKLDNISNVINTVIFIGCQIVFFVGMAQNFDYKPFANMTLKMLVNTVALAVAAIPESLPAIATTVVAVGIERIMCNNIIVKDTESLETLGETTVICCDKTGTLTRNKMELGYIFDGSRMIDIKNDTLDEGVGAILKLATACATLENDSTEFAIENACLELTGISKDEIEALYPRFTEIPFDSERKTMTTINMIDQKPFAIVKGAPEVVVPKCVNCDIEKVLKVNEAMANMALRIVCIAVKTLDEVPANPHPDDIENELKFVGLLGLADPPREEADEDISACKEAGIKTVMITGDNLITANAIAKQIGILGENDLSIMGEELNELSDEELAENIDKYAVFARISPSDKNRIVKAWQSKGAIVTVTGDGVADADALALADIGCSMSKFGNDVAKGNADVIITNNHFGSLVCAIRESRGLINNIKKSFHYLISCNFAELISVVLGMVIFGGLPINAVQILWINLLTDSAPALAISMEKADNYVMNKKNASLIGRLFDPRAAVNLIVMTLTMAVATLVSYGIGFAGGKTVAMTMAFLTLGLTQIFNSFNYKRNTSIISKEVFSNKFMNLSSLLSAFIILFLVFTPAGFIFGLTIISFTEFIVALALAFLIVPIGELSKYLCNKYF